jgi:hypothetical protein
MDGLGAMLGFAEGVAFSRLAFLSHCCAHWSRGWAVVMVSHCNMALARSAMVSVAVQNAGGEFFQPISKTRGNAISGSWPGCLGKTTPKHGISSGFTSIW